MLPSKTTELISLFGFVISFLVYIITIVKFYTSLNDSVKLLKGVVFKNNGELNVMTSEKCNERQKNIILEQNKTTVLLETLAKELKEVSDNVLILIVHSDIDVSKIKGIKERINER